MNDKVITSDMPVVRTADEATVPFAARPAKGAHSPGAASASEAVHPAAGGRTYRLRCRRMGLVGRFGTAAKHGRCPYLQADLTPLAARVPGYVRRVLVNEGFQRVKDGDLLVEIQDDDYRAQLRQGRGERRQCYKVAIATIEQQKTLQKALIEQAEAMVAASEADLTCSGIISRPCDSRHSWRRASRARARPLSRRSTTRSGRRATLALNFCAARSAAPAGERARTARRSRRRRCWLEQQAARDLAQINLGAYTRITAPVDGMVGQRQVQAGQYLNAGTQVVISLVPLPHVMGCSRTTRKRR